MKTIDIVKQGGTATYRGWRYESEHSTAFSTTRRPKWVFWAVNQVNGDTVGPYDSIAEVRRAIDGVLNDGSYGKPPLIAGEGGQ